MKRLDRQLIGILLVLAVILVGVVIQLLGPGLIVTEHAPLPPPTVTPQGFTDVTSIEKSSFHFALIPLVVIGIVGFVLAMTPKRDEYAAS